MVQIKEQRQPEVCKQCGSDLHGEYVRSAFWHNNRLVVIEDIPALVCDNCGEQFYDDVTVVMIDLLRGEGFQSEKARSEMRVPVFSLRDMGRGDPE